MSRVYIGRRVRAVAVLVALAGLSACGGGSTIETSETSTVATVETVRGIASIGETQVPALGRAALGQVVATGDAPGSAVRIELDHGARLILDRASRITTTDATSVALGGGRLLAEVEGSSPLSLTHDAGSLRLTEGVASVEVGGDGVRAYVVRGELAYTGPAGRGVVRAGQSLALSASGAEVSQEHLFDDWTGGLIVAGPSETRVAPGMGVLEAREPGERGLARWPLAIRRVDVRVEIVGELAITEVEQDFFNPASESVEGLYRVEVPSGAVLQRFAVDREGRLVDGFVREQAQARAAYEAQVYRGSTDDPALLEWDSPGRYRARIYPIGPGESRRIVIRYAEWLRPTHEGGPRIYRYPMASGASAPAIQELSFEADLSRAEARSIRAGLGATVEDDHVELRRSDFRAQADLVIEVEPRDAAQRAYRAAHEAPRRAPGSRVIVGEADERDFWYAPVRLPERLFGAPEEGIDLVLVADISAATGRGALELGRSVIESIVSRLGPNDRVAILSSDLTLRPVMADADSLGATTPERVEALLDALAALPVGGASDLGASLAAAATRLDPARQGAVVYVGDGTPTVGELEVEGLVEHLAEQPRPARLYAVGVGADANLELLATLTRGGGLALRVEGRHDAADASLAIVGHAARPILSRVTVDLGTGVENSFPREPVDVVRGEVLSIAGRIRERPPTEIVVRGLRGQEPFEERIAVETRTSDEDEDLRLRWANERLHQLLLSGARREEIAELGTRYGLITPFTSYYVPSAREVRERTYGALEHVPLLQGDDAPTELAEAAVTIALAPLSLLGCAMGERAAPASMPAPGPASESTPMAAPEEARSEDEPADFAEAEAPGVPAATPSTITATTPPPAPPMEPAAMLDQDRDSSGASGDLGGLGLRGSGRGGGGTGSADGTIEGAPPAGSIGLGESGTIGHGAGSGASAGYGSGYGSGPGERLRRARPARPSPDADPGPRRMAAYSRTVITTVIETQPGHVRRVCSDAASAPLADRVALWRERLSQTDSVAAWVDLDRTARRDCEAGTVRERRALLEAMLDRAGSLPRMIEVTRSLTDGFARSFFRNAILRRVRSADDLRMVRDAFGLRAGVDWALVEQVLARATTPGSRLRALRELVRQTPTSIELKLRLLEELEAQNLIAEARRFAERLRVDPLADPGARTAVGEFYLRQGLEDEARRTFSEIVEFQPMDELARRRLGDLYRAHGWFEDAYRQYETLVSIRPDDPGALLLLAQAAAGAGRIDEALRLEQRVMETSSQGSSDGLARAAALWSSVRFAELRKQAREAGDAESLQALGLRMRRSGVLRNAGALRVSLVWAHPDAQLGLWAAHPGLGFSRPTDLYSEVGIEAFDLAEQEGAAYRFEVRRDVRDGVGSITAKLVVVWNEGREDERVEIVPLTLDAGHRAFAWTLEGTRLAEAAPSADALRSNDDAPSVRATGGAR